MLEGVRRGDVDGLGRVAPEGAGAVMLLVVALLIALRGALRAALLGVLALRR